MQVLYRVSVLDESWLQVQRCWKIFLLHLYILHSSGCRVYHHFQSQSKKNIFPFVDVWQFRHSVFLCLMKKLFWVVMCQIWKSATDHLVFSWVHLFIKYSSMNTSNSQQLCAKFSPSSFSDMRGFFASAKYWRYASLSNNSFLILNFSKIFWCLCL